MSDVTTIDPTAALRTQEPTQTATAAAPALKPEPEAPPWLPDRLKQARQTAQAELLTKFGGAKVEDIEAKLRRLDELETASLTKDERVAKQLAELLPKAAEADRYRKLFSEQVSATLSTLPEEQRAAVIAYAGEDPAEQHRFIQALRMARVAAPAPGTQSAPLPVVVPPATTIPAGTAPAPASGVKTDAERWAEIRERDPIAGQLFHQTHARQIHGQ